MNQTHNICRLCASNTNVRHDILKNSILINTEVICLEEILYSTIGIKVFEEDGLSTAICDDCTNQITNFFVFKRKIEESENIDEDPESSNSESDISSQKEADALNELLTRVSKFVVKNKIFRLDILESNKKLEIIRTKTFNCPICSARFPNKSDFEEHFIACEILTSNEVTIAPDEDVESIPDPAENYNEEVEEEEDCIYEDYLELDNYSEKLETEEVEIEIENEETQNESTAQETELNQFLIRDFVDSTETQDQLNEETDDSNSTHKSGELSPTKSINSFIQIPNRRKKYKTKVVNDSVTYICSNCDKSFQSQSGLNSHIRLSCSRNIGDRTEEQILLFTCKNCSTVSCTTSQHFKHLSKCKGKNQNMKLQKEVLHCPKKSCQQEFTDLRLLRQHATSCCPSSVIARKFVRGKYNTKPKSQATFLSVDHIKQTSYCNFCNKRFDDEFMRENHIEIHKAFEYLIDNELLEFNECDVCHMVFVSKEDLMDHGEKTCSPASTVLECGSCGVTYYQNEMKSLKQHVFFKHLSNFVCPVESCKVDLKTPRFYYFHIQMRHPNFLKIDTEFKCQYCGKCFDSYPVLSAHRKKDCNAKSFKCNHCDKVYGSQSLLNSHLFKIKNPFICSICNKSCRDSSQLKIHMRTHTKERPYKCNICNATFTTPGLRAAHADKHNSQKQFQCGLCKKEFQTKMNLTSHMKNHTGAVHCKFCGNLYASKKSLECHMRSHKNNKSEC